MFILKIIQLKKDVVSLYMVLKFKIRSHSTIWLNLFALEGFFVNLTFHIMIFSLTKSTNLLILNSFGNNNFSIELDDLNNAVKLDNL